MHSQKKAIFHAVLWGGLVLAVLAPVVILAQIDESVRRDDDGPGNSAPEAPPNPNPTQRLIRSRNQQSAEQQLAAEWNCYDRACDQADWDPYQAYTGLVEEGYAVALTPEELEEGLICLAADGAVTGAVAGELVGETEEGVEVGAAIAIALELRRSSYLKHLDDPEARRVISRFERNLKHWERKFAACLRSQGYRVTSP
jgi:hypothetical protein